MEASAEELAEQLSTHGYKLTRQRRAVLAVITATEEHLSPAEIYRRAKADCPDIGLTTVYRTLELLDELGLVDKP